MNMAEQGKDYQFENIDIAQEYRSKEPGECGSPERLIEFPDGSALFIPHCCNNSAFDNDLWDKKYGSKCQTPSQTQEPHNSMESFRQAHPGWIEAAIKLDWEDPDEADKELEQ